MPRVFEVMRHNHSGHGHWTLRRWCVAWPWMGMCRGAWTYRGAVKLRDRMQASYGRETQRARDTRSR